MLARTGAVAMALATMTCSGAALAQNCPSGPFAGPYIGATLGIAGLGAQQYPLEEPKLSGDTSSFGIGGLIGYNIQCGRFVVGAEADISYADLAVRNNQVGVPFPASLRTSMDWYGTVRGRAGVTVHDNLLVYATAGVAFSDRNHWIKGPTPFGDFQQSNSGTVSGLALGGGIEFLHHDRWLLRAEALWVDLGREDREYVVSAGGCGGVCRTSVTWEETFWTARVGLSYKLGAMPAAVHKPLK